MTRTAAPLRRPRPGFTLVELLVVLVIIALLIALLIPAVGAAIKAAKGAAVQAEINNIAQALASFQNKYGDFPPSRIVLNESGVLPVSLGTPPSLVLSGGDPVSGTHNDITVTALSQRTMNAFRKFWPRVALTIGIYPNTPSPIPNYYNPQNQNTVWYDFNGNGSNDANVSSWVLQGHECLVFFLGGIPQLTPASTPANPNPLNPGTTPLVLGMTGFGRNPVNPFTNNFNNGNTMFDANRNPPFYEFAADRLVLTQAYQSTAPAYGAANGNVGFNPGYLDSLGSQSDYANNGKSPGQNFIVYFSYNNNLGYDPNDVNFENPAYDFGTSTSGGAVIHPPTLGFTVPVATLSPSPNPYTTSAPDGTGSGSVNFYKPNQFQLLSAGFDGAFGIGGFYNPSSNATPLVTEPNNTGDPGIRQLERDNLTNFHNGRLD